MTEVARDSDWFSSLLEEVHQLANAALPEILLSVLGQKELPACYKPSIDLYEHAFRMVTPFQACAKCEHILGKYVNAKLALRKAERKEADHLYSYGHYGMNLATMRRALEAARDQFHSTPCTCGLERWKGLNWRKKQSPEYQSRYQDYMAWRHAESTREIQ